MPHRSIGPHMPFLPARHYESEHTRFIRELLEKKPQLEEERRRGRAIWWDKRPAELDERRRMDESKVPMKPYVYHTE
jgi:hypothetical protein